MLRDEDLYSKVLKMKHKEFVRRSLQVPFVEKGRDFEGWDCWGLVYCYFKQVKRILLPEYLDYSSTTEYRQLKRLINQAKPAWIVVDEPEQGDVAIFNLSGYPTHVALVMDKRNALHAESKVGTFMEPIKGAVWGKRLEGIYRYDP